jgi:hypothetical protein
VMTIALTVLAYMVLRLSIILTRPQKDPARQG